MSSHVGVCPTTGKRMYGSARQAKLASRRNSLRVRCYICPACGRWHVTKMINDLRYRKIQPRQRRRFDEETW